MSRDTYISTSKGGKLNDKTRTRIKETLEHWSRKKIIVTITDKEIVIKKLYGSRSLPQNSLMHLQLQIFTDALNEQTGNDFLMEKIKEICKFKFLKEDVVDEKTGEVIGQYIQPTRDLDKLKMSEFMNKVADYAMNEYRIKIPFPEDVLELPI